jgi:hypothetical protein
VELWKSLECSLCHPVSDVWLVDRIGGTVSSLAIHGRQAGFTYFLIMNIIK